MWTQTERELLAENMDKGQDELRKSPSTIRRGGGKKTIPSIKANCPNPVHFISFSLWDFVTKFFQS